MAGRVRDYAAEYARRKALHPGDTAAARGHPSREVESTQRKLRRIITRENVRVDDRGRIVRRGYQGGKKPSLRGMVTRENRQAYEDQIAEIRRAQREYEEGRPGRGRDAWQRRDRNLPEWLFWYHGAFG